MRVGESHCPWIPAKRLLDVRTPGKLGGEQTDEPSAQVFIEK
jgi:hypothetical protein